MVSCCELLIRDLEQLIPFSLLPEADELSVLLLLMQRYPSPQMHCKSGIIKNGKVDTSWI
jgi:hypothetical protein